MNAKASWSYFDSTTTTTPLTLLGNGCIVINGTTVTSPYPVTVNNLSGLNYGINLRTFGNTKNWEITSGATGDLFLYSTTGPVGQFNQNKRCIYGNFRSQNEKSY